MFNNLLINVSHCTHTLFFQKISSHFTRLTPEPEFAPLLPRVVLDKIWEFFYDWFVGSYGFEFEVMGMLVKCLWLVLNVSLVFGVVWFRNFQA